MQEREEEIKRGFIVCCTILFRWMSSEEQRRKRRRFNRRLTGSVGLSFQSRAHTLTVCNMWGLFVFQFQDLVGISGWVSNPNEFGFVGSAIIHLTDSRVILSSYTLDRQSWFFWSDRVIHNSVHIKLFFYLRKVHTCCLSLEKDLKKRCSGIYTGIQVTKYPTLPIICWTPISRSTYWLFQELSNTSLCDWGASKSRKN